MGRGWILVLLALLALLAHSLHCWRIVGAAGLLLALLAYCLQVPDDQYSIELRIAVLGSSDVGKSTLLGVLTRGQLDNGRGCARLNVFRHRHEVYSGKTSSISIQTMGFDSEVSAYCEHT